jgi:hypothetical protein
LYTIRIFIQPIRSRGIGEVISLGRGCAIARRSAPILPYPKYWA